MKLQIYGAAALLIAALALGGCTGLRQFPSTSTDYVGDLMKLDPAYLKALDEISQAAGDLDKQKLVRNKEIDRRLRVIDQNFSEFQKGLSKENVTADLVVAVVEVGVGGAGALVAETASQILSAVSGGLAGAQQAYSKAALFDQTLLALLQQMIASRKAVLVTIYQGRAQGIDDYPLSAAVQDLDAYEFAGSLPGAVVATSADATVKNAAAKDQIATLRFSPITVEALSKKSLDLFDKVLTDIDKLSDTQAISLAKAPPVKNTEYEELINIIDPKKRRESSGPDARDALKKLATFAEKVPADLQKLSDSVTTALSK